MKTGKSPGTDNICIELLKTDVITAGNVFTDLSDIWTTNEIHRDWNKGLIIKIPKKGDLQNCDNWRGITLLSMPSKIFCRKYRTKQNIEQSNGTLHYALAS